MDREPTNQEVAAVVGIEESQVEKYRQDALLLGDGSWLVNFSYDMPRAAAQLHRKLHGGRRLRCV